MTEEKSIVKSKEEKSEEFKYVVKWDDIALTKYRCGYTNVDDKTFDVLTRGIKFFRSSDGTFKADDALPAAIQKFLKVKMIMLEFPTGNVEVIPRSIVVEQASGIPNLVMCVIEGQRRNGTGAMGGIWYYFESKEDLANDNKLPMISGEKVNIMAKSTTHLPTLAQKIDYCGRFGYQEMIEQEMRNSILQAVEDGSIDELCKLYNVITRNKVEDNPEEGFRELLKNAI